MLAAVLVLATGCGGAASDVDVSGGTSPTGADQETSSVPRDDRGMPGCESVPADAVAAGPTENVGTPAPEGYEVVGQEAQTVPPGGSATFEVRFEGAPAAGLWVLPGGEGITATMEGAEFAREELFGATLAVANVIAPVDGQVVVSNENAQPQEIAVVTFAKTGRRLSIDSSPSEVAPNEPVAVMVRLGEATASDAPCAAVTSDGEIVASLALQPDGSGAWQSTFRPEAVGHYELVAWVGGDRPRLSAASFLTVSTSPRRDEPTPTRGSGTVGD